MVADQLKCLIRIGFWCLAVQPDYIIKPGVPDMTQYLAGELAGVYGFCQLTDTTVLSEAVALAQHRHRLVEWLAGVIHKAIRHLRAGDGSQPTGSIRRVVGVQGPLAQFPQHRTGVH